MTNKICVSGYYGFDNFGDETILSVLIDNLKDYDLTVFSSNPEKTIKTYGVKSVHSFKYKDVLNELLKCDCLISGGGSLLQDKTSAKSLIYYLLLLVFAQICGKKTIIFAQGIGPVNNKFLNYCTIQVLKNCNFITVRDVNSLNLLQKYKINAQLCSDPVWNIDISKQNNTGKTGVQLRDFPLVTDVFIDKLANNINKYYSDKEICLLSLQNKLDIDVLTKLQNKLLSINPNIKISLIENTSNEKIINDISQMESLIAMRYHACLIAIKAGIKLLPINYDIKVETLAREFNLDYIDMQSDFEKTFDDFVNKNISYDVEKINSLKYDFNCIKDYITKS